MLLSEIQDAEKLKVAADKSLVKLNEQQKVKTEIKKYTSELEQLKGEEKKVQSEEAVFESYKNKLDIYDKLSPLRGEMTRYQDATKTRNSLTIQIEAINNEYALTKEAFENTILGMSELTSQKVTSDTFSAIMSAFEKEINTLDQEITHTKSKGGDARSRIVLKANKAGMKLGDKPTTAASLPVLNERKQIALALIKEANLNSENKASDIRLKIKSDSDNLLELREIEHSNVHKKEVNNKLVACQKKSLEYQEAIDKYTPLVKTSSELIDATNDKNRIA